jgi:putative hydrolase of the HAD superfamily
VTEATGPAAPPRPARPARIRAVLFDVDDTLLDYATSETAAIRRYLADLGVPADRLAIGAAAWHDHQERHFARYLTGELDFTGQRRARAADMLRWLDRPVPTLDEALDAWFDGYRTRYEASLTPFPDAQPCLTALASLADPPLLGVVSNASEPYTRTKLAILGMASHFSCVVCTDTAGCAKPDPRIFHHACAALNVPPDQTAYIGDRPDTDAAAATAAGLHGLWLDRANTPTPLLGIPRLTTLEALPAALGWPPSPAPIEAQAPQPDLGPRQAVR